VVCRSSGREAEVRCSAAGRYIDHQSGRSGIEFLFVRRLRRF
jgi:hypothetical protein